MDMRDHTEIPVLPFRAMDKINIKMEEVCGVVRKGRCYMSEAKRIMARKKRKRRK
mgnify:CR=1 FL=1